MEHAAFIITHAWILYLFSWFFGRKWIWYIIYLFWKGVDQKRSQRANHQWATGKPCRDNKGEKERKDFVYIYEFFSVAVDNLWTCTRRVDGCSSTTTVDWYSVMRSLVDLGIFKVGGVRSTPHCGGTIMSFQGQVRRKCMHALFGRAKYACRGLSIKPCK